MSIFENDKSLVCDRLKDVKERSSSPVFSVEVDNCIRKIVEAKDCQDVSTIYCSLLEFSVDGNLWGEEEARSKRVAVSFVMEVLDEVFCC